MGKKEQSNPPEPYSRLTVVIILLMIAAGTIIIVLDRRQVLDLLNTSNWVFLVCALICTTASYIAGSISFVVMMRVFGIKHRATHLFNTGLVSIVMQNLTAQPAGLSLRMLLLHKHGVKNSHTVAASLLLVYFRNMLFFMLVPFSLIYIVVSHHLSTFGSATLIVMVIVVIVLLFLAGSIFFEERVRSFLLRGVGQVWRAILRRDIHARLDQFNETLKVGADDLRQKKENRLPLSLSLLADVMATVLALWFCFAALGIPVHFGVMLTAFNFGVTLTLIPFIPGSMGVQEASMAGILALFGVPFSQGVIAAILFRVVYYFIPFVVTIPSYWGLLRAKVIK